MGYGGTILAFDISGIHRDRSRAVKMFWVPSPTTNTSTEK